MRQQSEPAHLWRPAHVLAAELVQWGTDANLIKTAAAYMKQYPEADFEDWLARLVQLGDLFSSSQQTGRYRQQMQAACERLQKRFNLRSGDDWAWVLGWAARLMPRYEKDLPLARKVSPVESFRETRVTIFQRQRETETAVTEHIPEVREEVSEKARSLFDQMQSLWGKEGDD